MFSGTDGDRNYPTQWALNPSAYQNVSNDQVDWAALAQQWIMMKETCPPEQVPPAPPPPPIGPVKKDKESSSNAGSSLIEGGEAPMEVENEKDETEGIIDPSIPPASWTGPATGPGSWGWQQQQWGWNTGWTPPPTVSGATPAAVVPPLALTKNALLPTPFTFPATDASASNYSGYRSNSYASGYWTSGQSNRMKGNKKHRGGGGESDDEPESTTVTLDAAKRRQLPAWIREGLEKMEREKQKQLDKEREAREREEFLKRKKQEEEEVRKVMTDSGLVTLPSKSKFESDSEDSGKEERIKPSFKRETSSPKRIIKKRESTEMESPPIRSKSKEERIQDVMLIVRRMMTEILLDVTTEEIENICQEELKRYRASASAMNPQKTPALASLTGKLGLGIYGESGSSGSESEHSDANDSDSNLKETIRRRKAEFMRTEREIDAHALDMERRQMEHERLQREHEQSGNNLNSSSGTGNISGINHAKDGERYSQVDTANSHYGHSEKPTPRKSRFHDGPINENTQLPKTDDYTYAGGSGTSTGNSKSINKNNTVPNNNSKSMASRKHRDKSSSSRSRTSSESKSDSSSESDSSGSHGTHRRHRNHRHHHHHHHGDERNRRRSVSERRNSKRDSRSRSVDSFDSRAGKVFKDPSTESKKERRNSKNGNSEDRRYSSPEYSRSKSSRSKRSYSRDRSSRSHRRSRSRDRRTKSRSRSRDRYSSRRSNSRDRRSKRSTSRDRHRSSRSYDRRDRSRSRNRSRSYHRRSRSRSQQRGKKSSHRH